MPSGSGGESSGEVRFAPYLETAHGRLLDHQGDDTPDVSFIDVFNATVCKHDGFSDTINEDFIATPYAGYEQVDIDDGFLGETSVVGTNYALIDFPSQWDMFGKFMAGLDVHDLWAQIYVDVVQGPEIENAVSAQSAELQSDIDINVMPKFLSGMRDINSVVGATAFVVGKAIIQTAHVRAINKFGSAIRVHAIDISNEQWKHHLQWNQAVITTYLDMFKAYYATRMDMDRANLEYSVKDLMWDINLFENARGILGAMSGGAATTGQNEPSQTQKAVGGALGGAAAGWQVSGGSPVGAVIGGAIGLASSFL